MEGEEKRSMDGKEKDDHLLEDVHLYITTSAYPEGCTDSRKPESNPKEGQEVSRLRGRAFLQEETEGSTHPYDLPQHSRKERADKKIRLIPETWVM